MAASKKSTQRQLIADSSPSATAAHHVEKGLRRVASRALTMRRKAATVLLAIASISLGSYAIFGHDGLVAYQQKQRQSRQLQQKIQALQQENQRLSLHDQRLRNDRDTIEYEAREQMHYTRPGEVIYTLPQAPATSSHK